MTSEPTTIASLKLSYIRSQTRLLSAPLRPPTSLPTSSEDSETPPLSSKTLDDILDRINKKIQAHNRLVFSLQSQRHVAEQIDAVYWRDVLSDTEAGFVVDEDSTVVRRDADLTESTAVGALPERWKDVRIHGAETDESTTSRYAELRRRLADATQRRDEMQKKMNTYRRVQKLLEPFEDAQENIQPNLVTRDGEMGKELDRMRVLIARVVSQLNQGSLPEQSTQDVDGDVVMNEEQKLANVLGLG